MINSLLIYGVRTLTYCGAAGRLDMLRFVKNLLFCFSFAAGCFVYRFCICCLGCELSIDFPSTALFKDNWVLFAQMGSTF